jgi:hypothetical protein
MADPLSIVATVIATGGAVVAIASRLWPSSPPAAPREASPPSASPTHAGSLLDADLAAVRGRVTAAEERLRDLEEGELRAQAHREQLAALLARIETRLEERTSSRRRPPP